MVPPAHGRWLASHLTGADVHISPADGHLTLTEVHLGEIHDWLVVHL